MECGSFKQIFKKKTSKLAQSLSRTTFNRSSMSSIKKQFDVVGEFAGFAAIGGYELKYLRLHNNEGKYLIKIPKEMRLPLYKTLALGDLINCQGETKDQYKWKAYSITKVTTQKIQQKILICQGSDCLKRGSQRISQELQSQLKQQGLDQQVAICSTGCLKNCKQGVNLIVMPEKRKYCQVQLQQIGTIIERINVAQLTK
jgi:(2Fe-2S) ferredoxin